MSVLDQATKHFEAKLGEMQSVKVPEWGTTVYFRPVTLDEQGVIFGLQNDGKSADAVAMTIILRARNEDGTRMFKKADKFEIMHKVDPDVITKIINAMGEVDLIDEDEEELAKNSETTATSGLHSI
tara:strand:+ start:798 stop:1175 length:378 start_codon:yes stop_codon:yes gene_type:complete